MRARKNTEIQNAVEKGGEARSTFNATITGLFVGTNYFFCEISGSHGGGYEDDSLLGRSAVWSR
jgi:hypothetical protein